MTTEQRTLVELSYSPWSERARWVLDHHGLSYRRIEHAPVLGERKLRRLLRNPEQRATVPVLFADGEVFTSSWEIALYADRLGGGTKLIPDQHRSRILELVSLADEAMGRGRALVIANLLASGPARDESLPGFVPSGVRPLLRPFTKLATAWFARKYQLDLQSLPAHREAVAHALSRFRAALGSSEYLLGQFSYADVVLASLLQGIQPVSGGFVPLGPPSRKVWSQPELAQQFADLLAWRDRLYASHRRSAARVDTSKRTAESGLASASLGEQR